MALSETLKTLYEQHLEDIKADAGLTRGQRADAQRWSALARYYGRVPHVQSSAPPTDTSQLNWWEYESETETPLDTTPPVQAPRLPSPPKPERKPQTWVERWITGPAEDVVGHFRTLTKEIQAGWQAWVGETKERLGLEGDRVTKEYERVTQEPLLEPYADVAARYERGELSTPEMALEATKASFEVLQQAYSRVLNSPTIGGALARILRTGIGEGLNAAFVLPSRFVKREVGAALRNLPTVDGIPSEWAQSPEGQRILREKPLHLAQYIPPDATAAVRLGPSIDREIDEAFPDVPEERLTEAKRALDSIPFSLDYRNGQHLQFIRDYLAAGDDEERKEAVVSAYENPINEAIAETVLDPLMWAELGHLPFRLGARARRTEHQAELAAKEIQRWEDAYGIRDKLLQGVRRVFHGDEEDWVKAARHATGVGRTGVARVEKLRDITHDLIETQSAALGLQRAEDIIDAFERYDETVPVAKSFEGRLVGQPLKELPKEFWQGLRGKARALAEEKGEEAAALYVKDEIAKVVDRKAVAAFGDPEQQRMMSRTLTWFKRAFSIPFLGYNISYPVYNFFDNARNMLFDLGPRAAGRYAWDSLQAVLGRAGKAIEYSRTYWQHLGYMPRRAEAGFGLRGIFSEAGIQLTEKGAKVAAEAEQEMSRLQRLWDILKTGPTLKLSGQLEEVASANVMRHAHIRALNDLARVGRGIRPLPEEIVARVESLPEGKRLLEELYGAINDPGVHTFEEAIRAVQKWYRRTLQRLGQPTTRTLGAYLEQVFDSETLAHLGADEDLLKILRRIETATTPSEVDEVIQRALKLLDDYRTEIQRFADAEDGKQIGWAVYDVDKLRRLAGGPTSLTADLPEVEQLLLSRHATDADVLWKLAESLDVDIAELAKPLTDEEVELIRRGGSAEELIQLLKRQINDKWGEGTWERYVDNAVLAKANKRPTSELKKELIALGYDRAQVAKMSRADVLRELGKADGWEVVPEDIAEGAVGDFLHFLSKLGEIPDEQEQFWNLYNQLRPNVIRVLKEQVPEFRAAARPGNKTRSIYRRAIEATKKFIEEHPDLNPFIEPDEWGAVQDIRAALQRYHQYRIDPEPIRRALNPSNRTVPRPFRPYPNRVDMMNFLDEQIRPGLHAIAELAKEDLARGPVTQVVPKELLNDILKFAETAWKEDFARTHYAATRMALAVRDFAILNYADKTYLDNAFAIFAPWHYWRTHNLWNWTIRLLDHPGIYAAYQRFLDTWKDIADDENLPPHLREKLQAKGVPEPREPSRVKELIPVARTLGFLGALLDLEGQLYLYPSSGFFPKDNLPIYGEVWLPDDPGDMQPGAKTYMLVRGTIGSGPLVDAALVALNNWVLPKLRDENSVWYNPELADELEAWLPPNALVQGGSFVPLSRQIRDFSIIAEPIINWIFEGLGVPVRVPPGGWNPEVSLLGGTLFGELLGVRKRSITEEYWTMQHLSQLVAEGAVTPEAAWNAAVTRRGTAWEMAKRRAAQQAAIQNVARLFLMGSSKVKFLPDEEMVVRGEQALYREARRRYYEEGDRDALLQFYQTFPEYKIRQLAFNVWDLQTGKLTEEELQQIIEDEEQVSEYYQKLYQVEHAWDLLKASLPIGSPQLERAQQAYQEEKRKLREQYGEVLDRWAARKRERDEQRRAWAMRPKAQAMKAWLDMYFAASPEERRAMLEALPTSMALAAQLAKTPARTGMEFFTKEDALRALARNYDPLDQVYASLEDIYYRRMNEIFDPSRDFPVVYPQFADEYEIFIHRDSKARKEFLEAHPEFAEAYAQWKEERDAAFKRPLVITEREIEAMLQLHPEWRGTEKEQELRRIAKDVSGRWTLEEFADRTKSDREIAIRQLWRFWNSLEEPDKTNWLRKFPDFRTFLDGFYHDISDAQLGVWLRAVPDVYDANGIRPFTRPDYAKPDWIDMLKYPIGEGRLPHPLEERERRAQEAGVVSEIWMLKEPEPDERYVYRPEIQFRRKADGTIDSFITPEMAETARKRSLAILNGKLDDEYTTWEDVWKGDPDPTGAITFLIDQVRVHGSLTKAIKANPNEWERLILGLRSMDEAQRLDFLLDYPDAWAVWERVRDSRGPTPLMYYELIGEEPPRDPLNPVDPETRQEYLLAKELLDMAYKGKRELFDHPLVKKWFPPESSRAKFWEVWYSLPKDARRDIARKSELIQALLAKGSRNFLDDAAYGAALEELRQRGAFKALGEEPTGRSLLPSPDDTELSRGKRGEGQRSGAKRSIGGGPYSQTRVGSRSFWDDFVRAAGPLLMAELIEVFRGRRTLSPEVTKVLERLRGIFTPDLSLGDFLNLLKTLYVRYGLRVWIPRPPSVTGLSRSQRQLSRGGRFFIRRD